MGAAVEKAGEEQGLDPIFRTGSRRSTAHRGGCLLIDLFSLLFFLRPWQRGSCRYGDCLLRVPPLPASPGVLPRGLAGAQGSCGRTEVGGRGDGVSLAWCGAAPGQVIDLGPHVRRRSVVPMRTTGSVDEQHLHPLPGLPAPCSAYLTALACTGWG